MEVFKIEYEKVYAVRSIGYKGRGDEYFKSMIGLPAVVEEGGSTIFGELKEKLNNTKKLFNGFTPKERKEYNKCVSVVENTNMLKGQDGIIAKEYNGEVITNAWLKMYELLCFCDNMISSKAKKNIPLHTMHFAEAPGNFILAFNHKISSEYPQLEWIWNANSYRSDLNKEGETQYLDDKYNLISNFSNRWFYGAEHNGDITRPNNIRDFSAIGKKYDIVTSDVKFAPPDMDYNEEENYNTCVQLGQVLCALATLAKDGIAILKFLSIYESATHDMIALFSQHFEKIYLTKPLSSKSQNSEIYIVGVNFNGLQIDNFNNALEILDYSTTMPPSHNKLRLFDQTETERVLFLFAKYITEKQIASIVKTVAIFRSSPIQKIIINYQQQNQQFADYWLKINNLTPLPQHKKIL